MQRYDAYRTFYRHGPGWIVPLARTTLTLLAALAVLSLGALAAPGQARAANGGAQIIFTAPIYAGQNNGDPEGPVSTGVVVAGSGWANTGDAVTIFLADRQNDTAGDPGSACTNGSPTVALPGQTGLPDATGNFTAAFPWPTQAGTQGHAYWVCGSQNGTTAKGVQAFTVLSPLPPSVGVSAAQVPLGGTVTVTGQNWLPGSSPKYDQKISIILAPCVACDPGGPDHVSSTTVSAQADGTFSVSLPLPSGARVGDKLYVSAQSVGDGSVSLPAATLNTGVSTAANVTVTDQPTATPAPSATPTEASTAQASTTAAAGGNGGGNSGGNSSSAGNTLLLVLLLALGGVLLLAAAVALILFMRSRTPATGQGGPGYGGHSTFYGQDGGFPDQDGGYARSGPPRRSGRPGPAAPYTNADYYSPPPRAGGRSGPPGAFPGQQAGWSNPPDPRGYPPEPDDDQFGDAPTIGTETPWQR
jgi:hypothetical protein